MASFSLVRSDYCTAKAIDFFIFQSQLRRYTKVFYKSGIHVFKEAQLTSVGSRVGSAYNPGNTGSHHQMASLLPWEEVTRSHTRQGQYTENVQFEHFSINLEQDGIQKG